LVTIDELALTPVNPDSPIPLYFQIEQDLRRLITSGQISPQATLPPELELCRAYGVGRHTIRMALSRLVADDLIARRAGRGTIVKPQTDRVKFFLDRSFTRQMADMGRQAHSKVLEMATGTIDETAPAVLWSKLGAPCLRLVRLRFGDNEPIGIQSSTVLTGLCPNLEKYDFDQYGLYDILATEYKLVISQIHHTIGATIADELQAELLQIAKGDPLLVVNTTAYTNHQQIVEYTTSYYRADRYEYSTTHIFSP
jgi:GntR family transcriptional regulator